MYGIAEREFHHRPQIRFFTASVADVSQTFHLKIRQLRSDECRLKCHDLYDSPVSTDPSNMSIFC